MEIYIIGGTKRMSETNVVKGYKVFEKDWTCRGKQYNLGKVAYVRKAISLCKYGIHFCTKMEDCFKYYPVDPRYKMAEVEAIGDVLYSNETANAAPINFGLFEKYQYRNCSMMKKVVLRLSV